MPISTDQDLTMAVDEWERRELARHADAIEASLESIRAQLASPTVEEREQGCKLLCKLICEQRSCARMISPSLYQLVIHILKEAEPPR